MTYGEVKRMALKLIFSDTAAGIPIADNYNDQADYLGAIPALVDSAQIDIAVRARKIPALVPLRELPRETLGEFTAYELPEDCREVEGLVLPDMTRPDYRLLAGKIFVSGEMPEGAMLDYRRYPVSVGSDPEDSTELDGTPDVHSAIPYFVAAQLVLYDDSYRYGVLRNEYESRVMALRDKPRYEIGSIHDVYGFCEAVMQ